MMLKKNFVSKSFNSPVITKLFHPRSYGRFIEIKSNLMREKLYRTIQDCKEQCKRILIQFRRER